jgi:hypothetical protein
MAEERDDLTHEELQAQPDAPTTTDVEKGAAVGGVGGAAIGAAAGAALGPAGAVVGAVVGGVVGAAASGAAVAAVEGVQDAGTVEDARLDDADVSTDVAEVEGRAYVDDDLGATTPTPEAAAGTGLPAEDAVQQYEQRRYEATLDNWAGGTTEAHIREGEGHRPDRSGTVLTGGIDGDALEEGLAEGRVDDVTGKAIE